jgi:folate-binding protein YgfZ
MASIDKDLHIKLGAELGSFDGNLLPASYGDEAGEYRTLVEGAGFLDRSLRSLFEVGGEDRQVFLQRLVSNDVDSLAAGDGSEAMLLTPKGMLLSHFVVYHRGDRYWIDLPTETSEAIGKKLAMYVLSSAVEIADLSGDLALLCLHGPTAERVLLNAGARDLPQTVYDHAEVTLGGIDLTAAMVDYLGTRGFDLIHPAGKTGRLVAALTEAGAFPVGYRAAEVKRIEAGIARFGAELKEGLLPPEVPALAKRAISYEKGCFVGQETIARIKTYGHVNRELRGLVLGGTRVPEPGALVNRSGGKVGEVTSACLVPGRERPIALAFVHRKHFDPGTQVEVEMEGGISLATVVPAGGPWEG